MHPFDYLGLAIQLGLALIVIFQEHAPPDFHNHAPLGAGRADVVIQASDRVNGLAFFGREALKHRPLNGRMP